MMNYEEIMLDMSTVLSELIQIASQLKEASSSSLAKEEIEALQQQQTALVERLLLLDQLAAKHKVTPKQHGKWETKVTKQIQDFQKLNGEFVDQLRGRVSCIQFSETR